MAYNMLLTRIPATTTISVNHLVSLRREDYPKVRFWTRQDWNAAATEQILEVDQPEESEAFPELDDELAGDESKSEQALSPGAAHVRGKRRSSQGINVAMKYIELEDGTVVDGFRAAEIRRYARSLWVQMALDQKLPRTWSDADAGSLATYNESMAHHFPELRLCAAGWKSNMVATDNYPSWRYNWLKKMNKEGSTSKRPADCHSEANIKKPKLVLESGDESDMLPARAAVPGPEKPEAGSFNMVVPAINIIPGTPVKPHHVLVPTNQQAGLHGPHVQPAPRTDLNFTIRNPLSLTSNLPLTDFTGFREYAPAPYQSPAASTEASTSAAANLPSTSALPSPDTSDNGERRSKGSRMRPTKTTTARNLCALEWIKSNPQGMTNDFKIYYNNLSQEQKQFWEDKSKSSS